MIEPRSFVTGAMKDTKDSENTAEGRNQNL
jgi:hypothetical protein